MDKESGHMQQNRAIPRRALVIGAGLGGLSCGIILAGLGCEVTILERNSRPGGLLRSYKRGGIDCEVGVHYLGSLDPGQVLHRFFDFLGVIDRIPVVRMGAEQVIDRYLFNCAEPDQWHFDMVSGLDEYGENLRRAFPADARAVDIIMEGIAGAAEQLHGLDLLYGADNDLSLLDQALPLGELLDDLGVSPGLRSVLAVPSCWLGVPLADCPVFYHNMALASYVSSSYRLLRSGAVLADVLARRFEELGGTIRTGAEVESVLVNSRQAAGVTLATGEQLPASLLIAAIHPKVLLAMLPEKGAVRPSYRQRINSIIDTHSIFSLHARVDSDHHPPLDHNIFRVDTDADGNVPDMRYYQFRRTGQEKTTLLSILTSGSEEKWTPWESTFTGRRGREYLQVKEEHAYRLLREAEVLFGSFSGLELLDSYTPLTIRDWVNSPGGSAYGVQRSASRMLATALLNRTSVQGLYLAGQSVMAPGVIGTIMGSFATIKLILGSEVFRENIVIPR
jgi:phytoene dehydrogenase-like protein